MPIKFSPHYTITADTAKNLMRIEALKEQTGSLPLTPTVLSSLRQTARLLTTHYSTMIEGNQLQLKEVKEVVEKGKSSTGHKKDDKEIIGYYAALAQLEVYVAKNVPISEKVIQTLHALAMSNGKKNIKPTAYRSGQNIIKDRQSGTIVYMPPEAKDVPKLMKRLVQWIKENNALPCPIVAAIAHYQFVTIHPYFDGNGRTARLLTTLILHLGGYDLKGLYSLEEYYAKNLIAYYHAFTVGPSHNYYLGRAEADITPWINYFCEGMTYSCEKVITQMQKAQSSGERDLSNILKTLDPKQRKVLELFGEYEIITSKQIAQMFDFKPRTSTKLCKDWVENNFLEITDPSRKNRKYTLSSTYKVLIDGSNPSVKG